VIVTNVPVSPSSLSVYSPNKPVSNNEGFVSIPNVDMAVEFSKLIKAKHSYKANVTVLRTLFEAQEAALDIIK